MKTPLRPVTDEEIESFWRDGFVCLRRVLPDEILARMAEPFEVAISDRASTDLTALAR